MHRHRAQHRAAGTSRAHHDDSVPLEVDLLEQTADELVGSMDRVAQSRVGLFGRGQQTERVGSDEVGSFDHHHGAVDPH